MNAFEFNKIVGSVLAALLAIFGTRTLINELRHNEAPEKPGYVVEIASAEATTGGGAATAAPAVPFAEVFAAAKAEDGAKVFKKCASCHTKDAGGPNRVGPNLHGIVGREIASASGFAFSKVLSAKAGSWTTEELNGFLTNPKAYAKGTKMAFAGLKKAKQRASLIKYLETLK